jgi:hypothetical protein
MTKKKKERKFFLIVCSSENAYSNFFDIFGYLPNEKIEENKKKAALSCVIKLLLAKKNSLSYPKDLSSPTGIKNHVKFH